MIAAGENLKSEPERIHQPVLLSEVLSSFAPLMSERSPAELGWIVDGTVGGGGHARALLESFPGIRLLGVDQDPEVLARARAELAGFGERVRLVQTRLSRLCPRLGGVQPVIGFLLDLGVNSLHFDRPERGFSLRHDGPLDMRMDPERTRTAADIVNRWDESDLADLFFYEGDERHSRAIARAIVEARARVPFTRTVPLADVIARALGGERGRIHPATRVFQALRRAVNEEGEELRHGLVLAERVLVEGGRLVVITFHSLEDGYVRKFLQERAREGLWQLVTKKPLGPGAAERRANPRARSALLRCASRTRAAEEFRLGGPDFPEPEVPEIDLPGAPEERGNAAPEERSNTAPEERGNTAPEER